MTLDATATASVNARETGEVWLWLLTISHVEWPTTFRFVNNITQVISRGDTFEPWVFSMPVPESNESQPPKATLTVDIIDRKIIEMVRSVSAPPIVMAELIIASEPDTVQASLLDLTMISASTDSVTMTCELRAGDVLHRTAAAKRFDRELYPGLFR